MSRCDYQYYNSNNCRPYSCCRAPVNACSARPRRSCCVGPTGPAGAPGASILGSYATYQELIAAHPTGNPGDAYLAGGVLYVWGGNPPSWQSMGSLVGPTGAPGASILGSYATYQELVAAHPTGNPGDAYLAGGVLYVWGGNPPSWQSMGSLIGPTGPTGAAGATILDSYDTYQDLINAHPTGTPGDAYLVDGVLYVWGGNPPSWQNMGSLVGPTGAAGATILDSYDTYQDLVNAHPTGTTGDAYLAEGVLYVWGGDPASWQNMGSLIGPTGPTGPQGENGADGIIGQITGVVENVADLPTTGVETGTIYYVEENDGVYVWDGAVWVMADVAQGPRGATGPTGPTGPQGADGIIGQITGVVENIADLPTTGVETGTIYYVEENDGVYVWDGTKWIMADVAQGPRGATGPTGSAGPDGPAASSYMIIPFSSMDAPLTHALNGEPSAVSLLSFSSGSLLLGADYSINIDPSDHSFLLSSAQNRQFPFSLPFDVSIRSLYITVGNWDEFDPDYAVFPYVQLFKADAGSNNFTVIEGAMAIPEVGIGPGTDVPASTMRSAHTDGLDIKLPAGTRIAIGAMMRVPGHTGGALQYWLYFTGGIGLTYEPAT